MAGNGVTPTGGRTKVFLSYSREDARFLGRLQAGLAARGYEPIYDQSDRPHEDADLRLSAQGEWWRQLQTMIGASDVMVFIVTPDSAAFATTKSPMLETLESASSLLCAARSTSIERSSECGRSM